MRKFKISNLAARRMQGLDTPPAEKKEGKERAAAPETPAPSRTLRSTSRTDVGLVRRSNQDAVIHSAGLLGIADGMGGHRGGETASAGARDGLIQALQGKEPSLPALEEAVCRVNLDLWNQQEADTSLSGMGTTLSVLWPAEDRMLLAHVGDSRVYLLRDGALRQVTQDHSMVADMVRRGLLTEAQAAVHPMRNYITRAVGTEPTIQVDTLSLDRQPGDRWLVCSDGLHGLVDKEELQRLLSGDDLEEAADGMLREALDRGGRDNISLVLAADDPAQAPAASDASAPAAADAVSSSGEEVAP